MKPAVTAHAILALLGLLSSGFCVDAATVEIALVEKHDEPRGFCLDIVGSQRNATPLRGLQAHSCYSYQGQIAVDQGFDPQRLKLGEFRLPGFRVCMEASQLQAGAALDLKECTEQPAQRFRFTANGQIMPNSNPTLCLTVDAGPSRPGGGGQPRHLIRSLSLQPCDAQLDVFQMWHLRDK